MDRGSGWAVVDCQYHYIYCKRGCVHHGIFIALLNWSVSPAATNNVFLVKSTKTQAFGLRPNCDPGNITTATRRLIFTRLPLKLPLSSFSVVLLEHPIHSATQRPTTTHVTFIFSIIADFSFSSNRLDIHHSTRFLPSQPVNVNTNQSASHTLPSRGR